MAEGAARAPRRNAMTSRLVSRADDRSKARRLRALLVPLALVAPVIVAASGTAQACGYHEGAGRCGGSHYFGLGLDLGESYALHGDGVAPPSEASPGNY